MYYSQPAVPTVSVSVYQTRGLIVICLTTWLVLPGPGQQLLRSIHDQSFNACNLATLQKTAGGILLPKSAPRANSDAHFGKASFGCLWHVLA